jgi:hypothetical protein
VAWLLFLPRLTGSSARVRVWRRLQKLGAISVQGAVWVLPDVKRASDALRWVTHELSDLGGGGVIARADWIEGLSDAALTRQFREAASAQWAAFIAEATKARRTRALDLGRRFDEIAARDFFSSPGKSEAARLLKRLRARPAGTPAPVKEQYVGRTWVTRRGIRVDRMASGWLIRRFIDPRARFRFVDLSRYQHRPGELRFDFDGAEFTHQEQRCTFEVLQARFHPRDRALKTLGELVHDLDFADGKFGHAEVAGFGQQLAAIASSHADDLARLERVSVMLDELYQHRKRR